MTQQLPVDPNYPRWVYGPTLPKGQIIQNEAQLLTLKGEWFSNPNQSPESRIDLPEPVEAAPAKGKSK